MINWTVKTEVYVVNSVHQYHLSLSHTQDKYMVPYYPFFISIWAKPIQTLNLMHGAEIHHNGV